MLAPEVWNFKAPSSHKSHSFKSEEIVIKEIKDLYFNFTVSVVLPNNLSVPEYITNRILEDSDYYQVKNVELFEFINEKFIKTFVEHGELCLISTGTHLDQDNCLCITPTGVLVLVLTKNTFCSLGVEGKISSFSNKSYTKYVVEIDLKCSYFRPGKKNYQHTLERFKSSGLSFDVIINWEPENDNICPSTIAAYFNMNYNVKLCQLKFDQRIEYTVDVPNITKETDYDELVEWLGLFSLQCNLDKKTDNFISSYESIKDSTEYGQVTYLQFTGLVTRRTIQSLQTDLRQYLIERNSTPWISLHVNGFQDVPIINKNRHHDFYTNGYNSFTLVMTSDEKYLVCKFISPSKKCRKHSRDE